MEVPALCLSPAYVVRKVMRMGEYVYLHVRHKFGVLTFTQEYDFKPGDRVEILSDRPESMGYHYAIRVNGGPWFYYATPI